MAMLPLLAPGANPGGGPTVPQGVSSAVGGSGTSLGTPISGSGAIKGPVGGKNSHQQDLVGAHSGMRSTITKGDPMSRAMNQYGKNHDATSTLMGSSFGSGLPHSGSNTGLKQIRGGTGQMRRIRGGLGPGKTGQAGPSPASGGYAMNNWDTE